MRNVLILLLLIFLVGCQTSSKIQEELKEEKKKESRENLVNALSVFTN